MSVRENSKVAVGQFTPIHMNKKATLEKLAAWIGKAGAEGARLFVTGETSIPTYPYWRNRYTYSDKDPAITEAWRSVVTDYYDQSVDIDHDLVDIQKTARKWSIYCVLGISERGNEGGSATLYNSQVLIDKNGHISGRRRKLIPTHEERTVWGRGNSDDIQTWPTDIGQVGALICYENHMLLPRAALAFMGEEIHCCCWPGWLGGVSEHGFASDVEVGASDIDSCIREYAFATQNFVLSASNYVPEESIPDTFPFKKYGNWQWAIGGSAIVSPSGRYLVEPVFRKEEILYATLDWSERIRAKVRMDAVGHYARPDVLSVQLHQGTNKLSLVVSGQQENASPAVVNEGSIQTTVQRRTDETTQTLRQSTGYVEN